MEYYNFICSVGIVYLSNLNLLIIKTHADRDIINKIKTILLLSEMAVEQFMTLCNNYWFDSMADE